MKNPFVYGKTVSGEQFCNRDKEIKELVAEIINCQNIIIFSPRRYGKTSLIKRVIEKVKAMGILTFYIDLYPAINKQRFVEIYAGAISSGISGGFKQIAEKIKEYLPRIIPKVVMHGQSVHFEFEFDRATNISPEEHGLITQDHIIEAIDILIAREASIYIAIWEALTSKQKNLLVALAEEKYPEVFGKNFLSKYTLGTSSSIQKAMKKILEKDLIQQKNGSYVVVDLFFKKWLQREL